MFCLGACCLDEILDSGLGVLTIKTFLVFWLTETSSGVLCAE